ncbi:MAG: amino acid ABC transporter substrate-binding protein [Clostridiaceae bacterium]|nr:amino acid ABC transporter substrate-binding protein [Clostridiaceae bacterium]
MKVNMNKVIAISLVYFIGLFAFTGCRNKDEMINIEDLRSVPQAIASEDKSTSTEKSVVIATAIWEPYEFEENGVIKGIGVDIVAETFKRMEYKVTMKTLPFARAIEMLKAGGVDMIIDIKKTAERQEFGVFSKEPIITTYTSLFVKSDSNIEFDGNILDLKPYKIGIIRDYTYGEEFDNAVKNKVLQVEQVDDKLQNIYKILDNRIDICIENRLVELAALNKTNNQNKLKELKPVLNETEVYAFFRKGKNTEKMVEEFDNKLVEIKKDGTSQRIYQSYIK